MRALQKLSTLLKLGAEGKAQIKERLVFAPAEAWEQRQMLGEVWEVGYNVVRVDRIESCCALGAICLGAISEPENTYLSCVFGVDEIVALLLTATGVNIHTCQLPHPMVHAMTPGRMPLLKILTSLNDESGWNFVSIAYFLEAHGL